jgi:hypothetical protein
MHKLDEFLSAYQVRDAGGALLDRITENAAQQPRNNRRADFAQVAMFAVVAIIGFWLGNAAPVATTAASQNNFMDNVILGPDSVAEMPM